MLIPNLLHKGGHLASCMRQIQREDGSITNKVNEMRDIATNVYKSLLTTQQFSVQQIQKRKVVLDYLDHKVLDEMAEGNLFYRDKSCIAGCWEECMPKMIFFLEYWDDIVDVSTTSL